MFALMFAASRLAAQNSSDPTSSSATPLAFQAASIKVDQSSNGHNSMDINLPGGRMRAINYSLELLMGEAYQLPASRVLGAPSWFTSEYFDIDATAGEDSTDDQNRLRLRALLADRFKLALHHETRRLPVYDLVLSKAGQLGPQLHLDSEKCGQELPAATPGYPVPTPKLDCGDISGGTTPNRVHFSARDITMDQFLTTLTGNGSHPNVDRPIVDKTGIAGNIDCTIEFAPPTLTAANSQSQNQLSSLPTALEEQLGLKLKSDTGPVDVIVIDHVEQPSAN
jgi:uncharacterized protein (TIGR03435 family)